MCGLQNYGKIVINCLEAMFSKFVFSDQSYATVPGRTMHDNISLVRDLTHNADMTQSQNDFLSLDQEKAFDHMNHDNLFKTLLSLWLHVGMLRMLYMSASLKSMVPCLHLFILRVGKGKDVLCLASSIPSALSHFSA